MVRNLIFIFLITLAGCEMNSKQIIKSEKFNHETIKFNSVTKNLLFENSESSFEINNMKKIIKYWFDNKIKTDGFNGSLEVKIKKIEINKVRQTDYFKVNIYLTIEFIQKHKILNKTKSYIVTASEYGEIAGNFAINDQENLTLNIMHSSLNSINKKILDLI